MTDLIVLTGVKEQHMIRVGDRLVATDVTDVDPSVRKHQLRFRGTLVGTAMPTRAAAQDVSNRYGIRRQQIVYLKFGHCRHFTPILRQTSVRFRLPIASPRPDECVTALSLRTALNHAQRRELTISLKILIAARVAFGEASRAVQQRV